MRVSRNLSRSAVFAVVVVLALFVSLVGAPVVLAQSNETNETNTTNETSAANAPTGEDTAPGNETNGSTISGDTGPGAAVGGNVGGGGGTSSTYGPGASGDEGNVGDDDEDGGIFPTPGEQMESIFEWFIDDMVEGINAYIEQLNAAFVGIAAPGTATDIVSWITPTNGMWGDISDFYLGMSSLAGIPIMFGVMWTFDMVDRNRQREHAALIVKMVVGIFLGMLILGAYLNLMNEAAMAFAPSGYEFMEKEGGVEELVFGHVIVLILSAINVGVIFVGGLILFGLRYLPMILYGFWPLILAMKCIPIKEAQSTANLALTALILVPILRVIQSLFLRLAFTLSWEQSAIGAQIGARIGTGLLLAFALLLLPLAFYRKMEYASGIMLSKPTASGANSAAGRGRSAAANSRITRGAKDRMSRVTSRAGDRVRPHAKAAKRRASNARNTAMSRAGGVMLQAKYGSKPAHSSAQYNPSKHSKAAGSKLASSSKNLVASSSGTPKPGTSEKHRARLRTLKREQLAKPESEKVDNQARQNVSRGETTYGPSSSARNKAKRRAQRDAKRRADRRRRGD